MPETQVLRKSPIFESSFVTWKEKTTLFTNFLCKNKLIIPFFKANHKVLRLSGCAYLGSVCISVVQNSTPLPTLKGCLPWARNTSGQTEWCYINTSVLTTSHNWTLCLFYVRIGWTHQIQTGICGVPSNALCNWLGDHKFYRCEPPEAVAHTCNPSTW